MGLEEKLTRAAAAAASHVGEGETVAGVLAAESSGGTRVYLCAFERPGARSWLVLDEAGEPVTARSLVQETASIAALCELAEESAGGGDLPELRARLLQLRVTEATPGIEAAEEAALALEQAIGAPPRVASAAHLDAVGAAARRLEEALGETTRSPFAAAMQGAIGAAAELAAEVQASYKLELV